MTEQEALRRAFGAAMRVLRRQAGYSQEKLALEGFARSHVSDLERGLRDPRLSTVWQICEILNAPLTSFAHEVERNYDSLAGKSQKDAVAVELGRKGGQSTARKRTPQQRSEAARNAARKRWEVNRPAT